MIERHLLAEYVRREYSKVNYYVVTDVLLKNTNLKTRRESKVDVVAFYMVHPQVRSFLCIENPQKHKEKDILHDLRKIQECSNYVYLVIPNEFYNYNLLNKLNENNIGLITFDENGKKVVGEDSNNIEKLKPKREWVSLLERLLEVYPKYKDKIEEKFREIYK